MMSPPADRPVSPLVRYRSAVREMIAGSSPALFITLAFNRSTTLETAQAKLGELHRRWCRAIFGKRWNAKDFDWPSVIAVAEHVNLDNLHLHLAVACDDEAARCIVAVTPKQWAALVPSGDVDCQAIHDAFGAGDYMAKELTPSTTDHLIILPSARQP